MRRGEVWALALAAAVLGTGVPVAAWGQAQQPPPRSLMVRLRSFLGLQPRLVSIGGTRSNAAQAVCLLSPGPVEPGPDGAGVRVLDPRPALVLGTPLNEIELRRGEAVLWSRLASSKAPISGRLNWPLPPLKPGERLELAMRPQGAAGGDWAVLRLEGASAADQQRYAIALESSGGDGQQRLQLLDQAASAGDGAMAQSLLWAPLPPGSGALEALQQEQQASCSTPRSQR